MQEGTGEDLTYTIYLDKETTKRTRLNFSVSDESPTEKATPNEDYLTGEDVSFDKNGVELTTNTRFGFVVVPEGIRSFTASVPVVDDDIIETDETAILVVGEEQGIGVIQDKILLKPEPTPDNTEPLKAIYIDANSVIEGSDEDLQYKVYLNRATEAPTNIPFTISDLSTATFSVDYLTGDAVGITRNVINNGDGSILIPEGVQSFVASVPVVDDDEVEPTETAILQIDDQEGIGQIFDNDEPNQAPELEPLPGETKPVKIALIEAGAVREGDGKNLLFTVLLKEETSQDETIEFSIDDESTATYAVDYLTGNQVFVSSGVVNNGDGTVTIPKGVKSFTASVPVVDDDLVEPTETAILKIGTEQGLGQIFDNDSDDQSNPPQPLPIPALSRIIANKTREGSDKDLIFKVKFDSKHQQDLSYQFNVGGDATFGFDYLTAQDVTLTNGVINNFNGSITVPKGTKSFRAIVPVIDDQLVENTETASIQIGKNLGIGQILDNDAPLQLTTNSRGDRLTISGGDGVDGWLKLEVKGANDIWQNNLEIINGENQTIVGSIGSTPKPHLYPDASYKGLKHIPVSGGQSFSFQQISNINTSVTKPLIEVTEQRPGVFKIALEDNRHVTRGGDFNDLVITAKLVNKPQNAEFTSMAQLQRNNLDAVLDLNDLETDKSLTLKMLKNTDLDNRIGLVKLEGSYQSGFNINGITPDQPQAFLNAVQESLIKPSTEQLAQSLSADDHHISSWSFSSEDAGIYSPVLITDDQILMTFGAYGASDGQQHVRVLGENVFGFEDDLFGDKADWHFDDVIVEASIS